MENVQKRHRDLLVIAFLMDEFSVEKSHDLRIGSFIANDRRTWFETNARADQ